MYFNIKLGKLSAVDLLSLWILSSSCSAFAVAPERLLGSVKIGIFLVQGRTAMSTFLKGLCVFVNKYFFLDIIMDYLFRSGLVYTGL